MDDFVLILGVKVESGFRHIQQEEHASRCFVNINVTIVELRDKCQSGAAAEPQIFYQSNHRPDCLTSQHPFRPSRDFF